MFLHNKAIMMRVRIVFYVFVSAFSLLSVQAQTMGDYLRQETRLDSVYQQYGLTGQGVIVAMIERGIDYRHPDFIDANGQTRIAYIFDMVDPSGANDPNNPYGVGTIYSRTQIDQALSTGNALSVMDRFGHGIACTGIAAGDGSGLAGAPYRGAAYGATIIAVEVTNSSVKFELLVRSQVNLHCNCIAYATPTQRQFVLDFIDKMVTEELIRS